MPTNYLPLLTETCLATQVQVIAMMPSPADRQWASDSGIHQPSGGRAAAASLQVPACDSDSLFSLLWLENGAACPHHVVSFLNDRRVEGDALQQTKQKAVQKPALPSLQARNLYEISRRNASMRASPAPKTRANHPFMMENTQKTRSRMTAIISTITNRERLNDEAVWLFSSHPR